MAIASGSRGSHVLLYRRNIFDGRISIVPSMHTVLLVMYFVLLVMYIILQVIYIVLLIMYLVLLNVSSTPAAPVSLPNLIHYSRGRLE